MFGEDKRGQRRSTHSRETAIAGSVLAHALAASLVVWIAGLPRTFASPQRPHTPTVYDLIWVAEAGPGGGGGGGGDRTPLAAPAREVGKAKLTVPTERREPTPVEPPKPPPLIAPLAIPAKPMAAADTGAAPGLIEPIASGAVTQGPGSDGGAGSGRGTGSGEGSGSGLGAGFGGGTGGGAYRPGSGVSTPELVREVKPNYTLDAMRAKLQGLVVLECVVLTDGTVGDVKVIKSLDRVFGLDEEAIKAAKHWRFVPGRRFGESVPVYITIELAFTLR